MDWQQLSLILTPPQLFRLKIVTLFKEFYDLYGYKNTPEEADNFFVYTILKTDKDILFNNIPWRVYRHEVYKYLTTLYGEPTSVSETNVSSINKEENV